MDINQTYQELLDEFGPQHWWPTTSKQDPAFEIIIGTILTQNTTWKNVEKAIANLKTRKALSPQALLTLPEDDLKAAIKPSGYYNQKAKKLRLIAAEITNNWQSAKHFAESASRNHVLAQWGIGPETADSILLYAGNRPEFVIDTYTKRLCASKRLTLSTYDEYKHLFTSNLDNDAALFNEYHALIVAWGKQH